PSLPCSLRTNPRAIPVFSEAPPAVFSSRRFGPSSNGWTAPSTAMRRHSRFSWGQARRSGSSTAGRSRRKVSESTGHDARIQGLGRGACGRRVCRLDFIDCIATTSGPAPPAVTSTGDTKVKLADFSEGTTSGFIAGLLLAAIAASPVYAQEGGELEEVVVTGSRMRGVEAPVGSTVITLDRQYIDQSNAVSTDKLIRQIPQAYNLGVSESSRGQPGGNGNIVFGNSANLRGIGPFATLVLVDGHRVVTNS